MYVNLTLMIVTYLFGLPDILLASLQTVQNTPARIVTTRELFDHITPFLHSIHCLSMEQQIEFKTLVPTYYTLNGLTPIYVTEQLHTY